MCRFVCHKRMGCNSGPPILAWYQSQAWTTSNHPMPDIYRRKENALQGMLACREASNWAAAMHRHEHSEQPNHLPSALQQAAKTLGLSGLDISNPVHGSHISPAGRLSAAYLYELWIKNYHYTKSVICTIQHKDCYTVLHVEVKLTSGAMRLDMHSRCRAICHCSEKIEHCA